MDAVLSSRGELSPRSRGELSPRWYEKIPPSKLALEIANDPEAGGLLLSLAGKMDLESLLSLYPHHRRLMEQPSFLYALTHARGLKEVKTFKEFVVAFEANIVTVRSYYHPGANVFEVLWRAVKTRSLPAILEGLNLLETPLLLDAVEARNEIDEHFELNNGEMYFMDAERRAMDYAETPSEVLKLERPLGKIFPSPVEGSSPSGSEQKERDYKARRQGYTHARTFVDPRDLSPQLVKVELIMLIVSSLRYLAPFTFSLTLLKMVGSLQYVKPSNYRETLKFQLAVLIENLAQRQLQTNSYNSRNYFTLLSYVINEQSYLPVSRTTKYFSLVEALVRQGLKNFQSRTKLADARLLIRLDAQSSKVLNFFDVVFAGSQELISYAEDLYSSTDVSFRDEVLSSENPYSFLLKRLGRPLGRHEALVFMSLYGKDFNADQLTEVVASLMVDLGIHDDLIRHVLEEYPVDMEALENYFDTEEWREAGFVLDEYLDTIFSEVDEPSEDY